MGADKTPESSRKRQRTVVDDDHSLASDAAASPSKKAKTPKKTEQKRLRRFRPQPPQSFHDIYARATSQRFFVLSRHRSGPVGDQDETVELAGTTGNIYTVVIGRQPTCDCPHAEQGNQCKHVLYVMSRVLRAKWEYVYQLALLSSELSEIFEKAGPVPSEDGEDGGQSGSEEDKNRKPVEGDCPICYEELTKTEAIVWCKASCGQNIHKACLEMWAATKRQQGTDKVTCPYCRSMWQGDRDMVKKIETTGKVGAEGYRNVADQLGISTERGEFPHDLPVSRHFANRVGRYEQLLVMVAGSSKGRLLRQVVKALGSVLC